MARFEIDGQVIESAPGTTVLNAAEAAGIAIPHFCYHPAFPPEGSCRMCLVEIEGLPKLELACSTLVKEGLKVRTKSPRVVEARKAVLEFLLAEHPLDCPICDKAGECQLQDYFDEYGFFHSRFMEAKEKREKKFRLGRNLILDRERCILCTRCVRFLKEITKTEEAGLLNRGIHCEVGVFESEVVDNDYSGNLAQICPVGAITDSDFRFRTRVWFLESWESICPLCGRGCNIYVDSHPGYPRTPRARRVYRIRGRLNPDVNSYWICDLGRYGYAYLDEGRALQLVWRKPGRDTRLTWAKAAQILAEKVRSLVHRGKASRAGVVLHSNFTNEELFLADRLFRRGLGIENIFLADPCPGKGDQILLTTDRTANRRGLKEAGPPVKTAGPKALADLDLLLVFGHYLASGIGPDDLKTALEKVETKALFSSHRTDLDDLVDFIIPTPVIAEKNGSLTNIDGRVQPFSAALDYEGEGLPEWRALLDLARELAVEPSLFSALTSPEAVHKVLRDAVPFFR
jgi:NADH-quinone oxidoreductase subunit G